MFSDHYELYNVWSDPSESVNLVATHPELFHSMKNQMQELINQMIPQDSPDNVDIDITDGEGNLVTGWC